MSNHASLSAYFDARRLCDERNDYLYSLCSDLVDAHATERSHERDQLIAEIERFLRADPYDWRPK